MTALDETTQLPDHPEFALVMRGYDRLQVDDYIERLTEWLAEAEHRQQRSEDDAKRLVAEVDARDRHIGELERERVASPGAVIEATAADVARLLEEASAERDRMLAAARDLVAGLEHAARADCAATVEQAGEIRAGAVQEADDIRARAEHAAEARMADARRDAEQLITTARTHCDELRRECEARQEAAEGELARLVERRQSVLAELSRLRGSLEQLMSAPAAVLAAVDDAQSATDDVRPPSTDDPV